MANDTKTKKAFGNYARAAAISRFLRKHEDITTTNAGSNHLDGVRVNQDNAASAVWLFVGLPDEAEAARWATQIADKLEASGYQVVSHNNSLSITCAEWQFDDRIGRLLFGFDGRAHLERGDMWTGMPNHILASLRNAGLVRPDALELTELGATVRDRVIVQRKKADQAERRRLRARGW